jgi:hypothetical protein
MAEAGVGHGQRILALQGAAGMDGEHAGVVADRADVVDVVRQTLQFGHDATQQHRARRRRPAERGLDGAGESPGVGHRAVARDAPDDSRGLLGLGAGHQAFDALVRVTQPLLEPHDGLAIGGETEVAWLDDAGMDRPDGDLVQSLALGRQEFVACLALPPGPPPVIEPGPGIRQTDGLNAIEVAHGALEAQRRRVPGGDRRILAGVGLQRDDGAEAPAAVIEGNTHRAAIGPQGAEVMQAPSTALGEGSPDAGVDRKPDIAIGPGDPAVDEIGKAACGAHPSSSAARWNQATSTGGRKMPAASTSSRCSIIGTDEALT